MAGNKNSFRVVTVYFMLMCMVFFMQRHNSCKILESEFSENNIGEILYDHNKIRSRVAHGHELEGFPEAANMLRMEWYPEASKLAGNHIGMCKFKQCDPCQTKDFKICAMSTYVTNDTDSPTWYEPIFRWYDEIMYLKVSEIKSFKYKEHLAMAVQVILAETWKIGCQHSVFDDQGVTKVYYACIYCPGLTKQHKKVYSVGEPCSECPAGSNCTTYSLYPGLCENYIKLADESDETLRSPEVKQNVHDPRSRSTLSNEE